MVAIIGFQSSIKQKSKKIIRLFEYIAGGHKSTKTSYFPSSKTPFDIRPFFYIILANLGEFLHFRNTGLLHLLAMTESSYPPKI